MARTGTGLGDNSRTIMGIIIYSLIGINGYIVAEVALGNFPVGFVAPFAIATIIAGIVKDQLGIRDATVSAASKKIEPTLDTKRDTSHSMPPPS